MAIEPRHRQLIGLMFLLAALLAAVATFAVGTLAEGAAVIAAFLFVYAAAALVSRLPETWGGARGRAWVREKMGDLGAGFYGVMGLTVFVLLEIQTLLADFYGPTPVRTFLTNLGLSWLMGFSLDSLKNLLMAMVWPVQLVDALGTRAALIVAGLCWGLLWGASRLLPADCLAAPEDADGAS
jgi:hypothetical protein